MFRPDRSWRRRPDRADRCLGHALSRIVTDATLKLYPGAPHGLPSTHKDQVNADLLAFLMS